MQSPSSSPPETTPRFRIYYADGSEYDGDPENAPGTGVIAIVEPDPDAGWIALHRWDVYCWHPAERLWYGHTDRGALFCLAEPGLKRQIQGKVIPSPDYRAILERALAEANRRGRQSSSQREVPWP